MDQNKLPLDPRQLGVLSTSCGRQSMDEYAHGSRLIGGGAQDNELDVDTK
jgi:hypothetical protein